MVERVAKRIRIAVRDFCSPRPTSGDIDVRKDWIASDPVLGTEIHTKIQQSRILEYPGYRSEVSLTAVVEIDDWSVEVSGRLDGLYSGETDEICEEIKTTFVPRRLRSALEQSMRRDDPEQFHPYILQALVYAWIRAQSEQGAVSARILLVDARTETEELIELSRPNARLADWIRVRAGQVVTQEISRRKFVARSKRLARDLKFPMPSFRPGQNDLISAVESACKSNGRLLVQAPTGLGKSIGVLFPAVRSGMQSGRKVLCVAPKNSQHEVAEKAVESMETPRVLTVTARAKICMKTEVRCDPDWCEFAREHFTKVTQGKLLEKIAKKTVINAGVLRKFARKYQVCPYVLGMQTAERRDVIISDYNYVFSPGSTMERDCYGEDAVRPPPHVVIDEVHNLPARAMDYLSPEISTRLARVAEEAVAADGADPSSSIHVDAHDLCVAVEAMLESICSAPTARSGDAEILIARELLDKDAWAGIAMRFSRWFADHSDDRPEGASASETSVAMFTRLRELSWAVSAFAEVLTLAAETIFPTAQWVGTDLTLRLNCCDASLLLAEKFKLLGAVVGFSATLKPFPMYANLGGFRGTALTTLEIPPPFPPENRRIMLVPQISTRLADRKLHVGRIAELLTRVVATRQGNYMAFLPSFGFLHQILDALQSRNDTSGITIRVQPGGGSSKESQALIDALRAPRASGDSLLILAVSGGVLSEGVDLPGDALIGAFVVGPPLPAASPVREQFRRYYQKTYGDGFNYAFVYPAMARAIQAAGRVIRTVTDRGIIMLIDGRFAEKAYAECMPCDWFRESSRELIPKSIITELQDFWTGSGRTDECGRVDLDAMREPIASEVALDCDFPGQSAGRSVEPPVEPQNTSI